MKVQKLYEMALAYLGKTEEGTAYPFMARVPVLLNLELATINAFRTDEIDSVSKISDTLSSGGAEADISDREAQGLALCLAVYAASEIEGISDTKLSQLVRQRNMVMGSINTGMEQITETVGVS